MQDAAPMVEGWKSPVDDQHLITDEASVDQPSPPVFWLNQSFPEQPTEAGATDIAGVFVDATNVPDPPSLPASAASAHTVTGPTSPTPSATRSGPVILSSDGVQSVMAPAGIVPIPADLAAVVPLDIAAPQPTTASVAVLPPSPAEAEIPALLAVQKLQVNADKRDAPKHTEHEDPPNHPNPPSAVQRDLAPSTRPNEASHGAATVALPFTEGPVASGTTKEAVAVAEDAEAADNAVVVPKNKPAGLAEPSAKAVASAPLPIERLGSDADLQRDAVAASPHIGPPQPFGEARFGLSLLGPLPPVQMPVPFFAPAFPTDASSAEIAALGALIGGAGALSGTAPTQHAAVPAGPATGPVAQLAAQIVFSAGAGQSATELTLSPKELGDVRLSIRPHDSDASRVVVMMTFERPEAMDLFRRNADLLVADLRAAGFSGAELGFAQSGSEQGRNPGHDARAVQTGTFEGDLPVAISALPARNGARSTSLDLRL